MSLPDFDEENENHIELSKAAMTAHECADSEYESAINKVRDLAEIILGTRI